MTFLHTLPRSLAAPVPGILDLLGDAGPMALGVLGLLGLLSIVSWGIMVERWRRFRLADRESGHFRARIGRQSGLADLNEFGRHLPHSPLAALFTSFFQEVVRFQTKGMLSAEPGPVGSNPGHLDARVRAGIVRALEKAAMGQTRKFQRFLGFLATTATVAPFIGRFGTVWGIMNAFRSIGAAGAASIAAYAPGIAEALVTTAAGLAAAIPAVAGYNYFVARLRHLDEEMEDFAADLVQRLEAPR